MTIRDVRVDLGGVDESVVGVAERSECRRRY